MSWWSECAANKLLDCVFNEFWGRHRYWSPPSSKQQPLIIKVNVPTHTTTGNMEIGKFVRTLNYAFKYRAVQSDMSICEAHHTRLVALRPANFPCPSASKSSKVQKSLPTSDPRLGVIYPRMIVRSRQSLRPCSLRVKKASHPLCRDKLYWGEGFSSSRLSVNESSLERRLLHSSPGLEKRCGTLKLICEQHGCAC